MTSDAGRTTRVAGDGATTAPARPPLPPAHRPAIAGVLIEDEIGRGGMGVVYRGHQAYLDRRVAVKLLPVDTSADSQEYARRFQREAKLLAGLSHPSIVACYQAGITGDGHCYLVMEYIDGPSLAGWLREHGPLQPAQALAVVGDLARALGHAQAQGLIHRDVKPENVLLQLDERATDRSFPYLAKLADLGLARPSSPGVSGGSEMNVTAHGLLMGTPATMSPEQFDDPRGVDWRTDVYGLGCVLFHALTGRPAFSGQTLAQLVSNKVSGNVPNPAALRPELPRQLAAFCCALLARDREDRPQSYQDIAARCAALAVPPAAPARRRWPALAVCGLAASAAALALWWLAEPATPLAVAARPGDPVVAVPVGDAAPAPATPLEPAAAEPAPPAAPEPGPPGVQAPPPPPASLHGLVFRERVDLTRLGQDNQLADWRVEGGNTGGWGIHEELEHSIVGHGVSQLSRDLRGKVPWRLSGRIAPRGLDDSESFREAGLRVTMCDGHVVTVGIQIVGSKLLTVTTRAPGQAQAERSVYEKLGSADELPFAIAWHGRLHITVGGLTVPPLAVGDLPGSLALYVDRGAVVFSNLALAFAEETTAEPR